MRGRDVRRQRMSAPVLSVVIPVYNEEAGLPALFARLYPALDALGVPYEVIFVNDGSRDRSGALLKDRYAERPDVTRVVYFNANYGQHLAILAGFERVRGQRVVTLDADLQNPPEEIGKLLAAMDEGADYVGGVRRVREDSWWRRTASRLMNRLRERITRIRMTDQGCMLRAYSRDIVDAVAAAREVSTFIPALAYTFAHRPAEVDVMHEERAAGESKYSLYRLIRLNFDLITGFSLVPLQLFSVAGMIVALTSVILYIVVIVQRALIGGFVEGIRALWDRDILAFFLIGCIMFGVGLLGEYVGRIYQQVRDRPRYVIRAVLERATDDAERDTDVRDRGERGADERDAAMREADVREADMRDAGARDARGREADVPGAARKPADGVRLIR
jgi:undecaprenyl-phosphate 4-deoxy-4-formamido-L-arabinose transferase